LPFNVGFRGKVKIAAIRLGFTGERGFEILVGLRAFELHDASV
jgi:glycine cleavage system aminomethyltransferase T